MGFLWQLDEKHGKTKTKLKDTSLLVLFYRHWQNKPFSILLSLGFPGSFLIYQNVAPVCFLSQKHPLHVGSKIISNFSISQHGIRIETIFLQLNFTLVDSANTLGLQNQMSILPVFYGEY